MAFGQSLQGCECRWHLQVVGIGLDMFGQMVDYEIAHAPAIEVVDIAMAVVALGFQCKEQRFFRETK